MENQKSVAANPKEDENMLDDADLDAVNGGIHHPHFYPENTGEASNNSVETVILGNIQYSPNLTTISDDSSRTVILGEG